jgi:hypothetical protein
MGECLSVPKQTDEPLTFFPGRLSGGLFFSDFAYVSFLPDSELFLLFVKQWAPTAGLYRSELSLLFSFAFS